MIDFDSRVRESLASQVAHAPDGADLLGAVYARSRRDTVRRRFGISGLAAAVAVLVMVPLLSHLGERTSTLQPATPDYRVVLEPGPEPTLSFPLTPGWLPPGLTAAEVWAQPGTNGTVSYDAGGQRKSVRISIRPDDWTFGLPVEVNPPPEPTMTPIQVGPKTGKLISYGDPKSPTTLVGVLFERKPGQWVTVARENYRLNGPDLARIAASLTDQPQLVSVPFTFALLPRGYHAAESNGEQVTLVPKGVSLTDAADRKFVVVVQKTSRGELEPGKRITVGGRPGTLQNARGMYKLQVRLGDAQRMEIAAPTGALNSEAFLRYAEGVEPKPGTRAKGG